MRAEDIHEKGGRHAHLGCGSRTRLIPHRERRREFRATPSMARAKAIAIAEFAEGGALRGRFGKNSHP